MKNRFRDISEQWFLVEPALFQVYCTHSMVENTQMACAMRTGKGRVEYNPALLGSLSAPQLEHTLRAEMIRILLKHPYMRQPENCSAAVVTMASNCVLTNNYTALAKDGLTTAKELDLPEGEAFEWYAHRINANDNANENQNENANANENQNGNNGNNENNANAQALADQSEMWEEDQMLQENINELIASTTNWGTLAGKVIEQIIASTKPKIDYRRAFAGFRSSVISSRRHLTRMRPNRRMEFEQMGSVYQLSTRLLIAVDVSGSVSSQSLAYFYGLIRRFFKYGIEQMDVVQFDAELGEVQSFQQRQTRIAVCGRGGTSFQPAIDYAAEHQYDGLCILTDGYAPVPAIPLGFRCPLLWVLENEKEYNEHHSWMQQLPHSRVCWLKM